MEVSCMIVDVSIDDQELSEDAFDFDPDTLVGNAFDGWAHQEVPVKWGRHPRVTIYGRSDCQQSVAVHVLGFRPSLVFPQETSVARIAKAARCDPSQLQSTPCSAALMDVWCPDLATKRAKVHDLHRVSFPTVRAYRQAKNGVEGSEIYEESVDLVTQFLDLLNLSGCSWICARGGTRTQRCHADVEFECDIADVRLDDKSTIAPLLISSFDIECVSADDAFPTPEKPGDAVVVIGVVHWYYGTPLDTARRVAFCTGPCDDADGVDVRHCKSEAELLREFRDHLTVETNPDVLLSYNGLAFDWSYLWKRAARLGVASFQCLSRARRERCRVRDMKMQSNQRGTRHDFYPEIAGRVHIDMMQWYMTNRKASSYKLDDVAFEELGERKLDMTEEMPEQVMRPNESAYKVLNRVLLGKDAGARAKAVVYCIQDCFLPTRLLHKLKVIEMQVSTANVQYTRWQRVSVGGEGAKVRSQFVMNMHRQEPARVLPTLVAAKLDEKYEGATVIAPDTGFYTNCVTTLDFASLYPSIMQRWNLCITTLVRDATLAGAIVRAARAAGVPGEILLVAPTADGGATVTHGAFEHEVPASALLDSDASQLAQLHTCTFAVFDLKPRPTVFVQSETSVTSKVLSSLGAERKRIKKLMQDETDKTLQSIYDGQQKAVKVSMNSIYGQYGASVGVLPCLEVAQTTTFVGRCMIQQTKEIVEREDPRCKVIYGDTGEGALVSGHVWSSSHACPCVKRRFCLYTFRRRPVARGGVFARRRARGATPSLRHTPPSR